MDGLIMLTDLSHRQRHRQGRSAGVATLDAEGRLWVAEGDAGRLGNGRWSAAYRPVDGMLLLWAWRAGDGGWREPVRVRGGRSVGVRLAGLMRAAGLPKPAGGVDLAAGWERDRFRRDVLALGLRSALVGVPVRWGCAQRRRG